jgi:hypothetical protein
MEQLLLVTDIMKKHDKSIWSGAQSVTLQQYFSHPSLVIYFFPTTPIKLKLELQ